MKRAALELAVARDRTRSACLEELARALELGAATYDGEPPSTKMRAHSVRATWSLRSKTVLEGNIENYGFQDVLVALEGCAPDELVTVHPFDVGDSIFTVFVSEDAAKILGCLCVVRRRRTYEFDFDDRAWDFCEQIVRALVRSVGMDNETAAGLVNARWQGQHFCINDKRYETKPEVWAHTFLPERLR